MSEPLYVGGWGFSTTIGGAWQAAHAWQFIKALRLVRLRQRNTHRRIGRPSLASLPVELMQMIEDEIIEHELLSSMDAVPGRSCGCDLLTEFTQIRSTRRAFNNYVSAAPGSNECWMSRGEAPCDECWWAFEESEVHDELWKKHLDLHSGACQQFEGRNAFFTMLLHACQEGFRFAHHGPATPVSILHAFLADHHLRVLRIYPQANDDGDNDVYDEEEDDAVSDDHRLVLVFKETRRWSSTLMEIRTRTHFELDRRKVAYRLRRTGLVSKKSACCAWREKTLFRWRTARIERLAILGKGLVEDPDSDDDEFCDGCVGGSVCDPESQGELEPDDSEDEAEEEGSAIDPV